MSRKQIDFSDDEEEEPVNTSRKIPERPKYREPVKVSEPTNYRMILLQLAACLSCLLFGLAIALVFHEQILNVFVSKQEPFWQLIGPEWGLLETKSELVAHNTTTVSELMTIRKNLAYHLSRNKHIACLCMHHLLFPVQNYTRVRVCSLVNENQLFFMRNPYLVGYNKGAQAIHVREQSISCAPGLTYVKPRANMIYVEWEDETQTRHYSRFRDEQAFCLQLALEEFDGKKHCPEK